jgi:hypothetical protein
MPSLFWIVEDNNRYISYYDLDTSEKELDNSEEKEVDKNEMDIFNSVLYFEKTNFIFQNNKRKVVLFYINKRCNSLQREIYSPPPKKA